MRVDPKYLDYKSLPSKKKKARAGQKLPPWWENTAYAAYGYNTDDPPKRRAPYVQSNTFATSGTEDADIQRLNQFEELPYDQQVQMDEHAATAANQPKPKRQYQGNSFGGVNLGPIIGGALGAINQLLPNDQNRRPLAPQMAYNPYAYGTGSQAISKNGGYIMAKDGHWIQKAVNPAHKGYCTPMTKSTCTPRRKALAKTFKKHHGFHENGGIIPDNMSNFNPQDYERGGNVNGGADIREVGYDYPNTDLMEQWLLYDNGGPLPPPGRRRLTQTPGIDYNFGDMGRIPTAQDSAVYRDRYATAMVMNPNDYNKMFVDPYTTNMQSLVGGGYNRNGRQGPVSDKALFDAQNMLNTGRGALSDALQDKQRMKPRKSGGTVGNGESREVGPNYPNTDLLEQWIPWMTGNYRAGGNLSPSKAMEMLHDGTANGKKLTAKQKRYFGMVAHDKAALGDVIGDPENPKPGTKGGEVNPYSSYYATSPSQRAGKYADELNELIAKGYDPYSSDQGKATLNSGRSRYSDAFAHNIGVKVKALQSDPFYKRMNAKQRLDRFYNNPSGNPEVDDYLKTARVIGGSPSAYYNGSPVEPTIHFKHGGVMYDDGGAIDTMWGGNADLESYNPYDGGTIAFDGASHDNGGIGMAYNGSGVEVEGGEYASRDQDGSLNIYGNMNVPGTKTKFKSLAGKMAKQEKRYGFLQQRGAELVNNTNPANTYDLMTFNSGKVMMQGGAVGMKDIAKKKQAMSALQRAMLDTADKYGLDPEHMSQGRIKKAKSGGKARGGASLPFFQDGGGNDPTMADRNNNPGNIKWGKYAKSKGAKKGPPADDGGFFAIFPSKEQGLSAMKSLLKSKSYKDLNVDSAIHKWTGTHPYRYDPGTLKGKTIGSLDDKEFENLVNIMRTGEGTRYGLHTTTPTRTNKTPAPQVKAPPTITPFGLPRTTLTPEEQNIPVGAEPPPLDEINVPERGVPPTNAKGLGWNQLLGEMYGFATNDVEPVPHQRYDPQLYVPYQMSFQDRLNENQASFSAMQRALSPTNPEALSHLASQKYAADNGVLADEFRTNQAIANDVTNKNVGILNDAQLKNIQLADTQGQRQSLARSKTRELNQMIFNSVSDKFSKNNLENQKLAAYENLYDYRFVPTEDGGLKATYFGPNAAFNYNNTSDSGSNRDVRTISRYDAQGNLKGYSEYDDYDTREQQRQVDLEYKRRRLPLMKTPKLN